MLTTPSLSSLLTPAAPAPQPAAAPSLDAQLTVPLASLNLGSNPTLVMDALSLRTSADPELPYAPGVQMVNALNSTLQANDAYSGASAVSSLVGAFAPTLSNTILGVGPSALMLLASHDPLQRKDQALLDSVQKFREATNGRVSEALGVASATTQVTLAYRTVVNASYAVGSYGVKLLGKVPGFAGDAASLKALSAALAATPIGKTFMAVNRWMPLLNVTWLLMAMRGALQIYEANDASKTSKILACLNVGSALGVLMAGISSGCAAFFATVLGAMVVEMMLATARQVDAQTGDTDQRMALAFHHPVAGLEALGKWGWLVVRTLGRQQVDQAQQAVQRVTAPPKKAVVKPKPTLTTPRIRPDRVLLSASALQSTT